MMTVNIVLVTHENIGNALVQAAETILARKLKNVFSVSVQPYDETDRLLASIDALLSDNTIANDEILLLTDIVGSTPCNMVSKLLEKHHDKNITGLTGINLAMLLKALNYQQLSLAELTEKVVNCGKVSVSKCQETNNDKENIN